MENIHLNFTMDPWNESLGVCAQVRHFREFSVSSLQDYAAALHTREVLSLLLCHCNV